MDEPGRFLVVRLERGLHPSRVVGLFHAFRTYAGVVSVCDLSAITQETLDVLLMVPDPEVSDAPVQLEMAV